MSTRRVAGFTEFERILIESENELGTVILLVFIWIAASDGEIDEKEKAQLLKISAASRQGYNNAERLLMLANNRDIKALQLSCEIIARAFRGEKAGLFLEMAIGMAVIDGYLLPTENYILRFLADLLGIDKAGLNSFFVKVTGRNIPDPSDVSSADYWKNRKQRTRARPQSSADKIAQACGILGIKRGASEEEIRKAYRRLAQIHHPDRFSSLGKEAVALATIKFQKINEAYQTLIKNA